jgi:hypothetical protein
MAQLPSGIERPEPAGAGCRQGSIDNMKWAVLETNGDISFIKQ